MIPPLKAIQLYEVSILRVLEFFYPKKQLRRFLDWEFKYCSFFSKYNEVYFENTMSVILSQVTKLKW